MQEGTTPIFKRLWYNWTQQQPGIEPTNWLVPPIVAFYDQQGLLRTYLLLGGSIRSAHPGSPQASFQKLTMAHIIILMRAPKLPMIGAHLAPRTRNLIFTPEH